MSDLKPEIIFKIGARKTLPLLTGDRPVVMVIHAHANNFLINELHEMFGVRLREILFCPDGLLSIECVDQMRQSFWSRHDDQALPTLIAIGGGSTLDLAKTMRISLPKLTSIKSILDRPININDFISCPLLLLPTTAGSGSEVSSTATLWDTHHCSKHSFYGTAAVADWAVIDPELCLTAPWHVTRDSGIDALAHALEAIWNRQRVPKSLALALSAAQQITRTLPSLADYPQDVALRAKMSQAALWAGQAMALTETALVHALSYEETLINGISHGEACAKWLPRVYKLARESSEVLSIYLSVAMEPVIRDEWALQEWLINLGFHPVLLNDNDPAIDARIQAAFQSKRGKNFVTAEQLYVHQ